MTVVVRNLAKDNGKPAHKRPAVFLLHIGEPKKGPLADLRPTGRPCRTLGTGSCGLMTRRSTVVVGHEDDEDSEESEEEGKESGMDSVAPTSSTFVLIYPYRLSSRRQTNNQQTLLKGPTWCMMWLMAGILGGSQGV